MKKLLSIVVALIVITSCTNRGTEKEENTEEGKMQEVQNKLYELIEPKGKVGAVLVLFGGYSEEIEDIKEEFGIAQKAMKKGVAVVLMNYNQKLWLETKDKDVLSQQLQDIFSDNDLPENKIYFGGFSSGGNVALGISNYLSKQNAKITPKGVFVVDSPVDLLALYKSSQKNIERNFSKVSVQESTWLVKALGSRLGNPLDSISHYENYSIYTMQTDNIENVKNLKNMKIRFYTEPDTVWWKENRMADFDQMNAYYLQHLSKALRKAGFEQVEYIATENRGYRANGDRHPHSWSIVDQKELMKWVENGNR